MGLKNVMHLLLWDQKVYSDGPGRSAYVWLAMAEMDEIEHKRRTRVVRPYQCAVRLCL